MQRSFFLRALLALTMMACALSPGLRAQEEPAAAAGMEEQADGDAESPGEGEKLWELSGYIESENFIMFGRGLKKSEYLVVSGAPVKVERNQHLINKAETHGYLDLRVGNDTIHARAAVHGYVYPTGNEAEYLRNRVLANELYLRWLTAHTDLKIGTQTIRWGTADVINPTSYFTPMDLREVFFKDEDEMFLGVHAVSLSLLFGDYSLQLVCAPIASATLLPSTFSPWYVRLAKRHHLPLYYYYRAPDIPKSGANICYGGRFSGTASIVDFSFSAYRGIDRDVLLAPAVDLRGPLTTVYVMPRYRNLTCFGFDIAVATGDVTLQAEAAYSFNKNGVTEPDTGRASFSGIEPAHYLNVAAGLNWLVDGEDFNITLEINKSMYLVRPHRFIDPLISNLVIARVEKKFFNGSLCVRLQGMMTLDLDFLLMPSIGYDFRNGLLIEAEGGIFGGSDDTLFGSYNSRDIMRVRAKYQF
ncbi:MAG: hypothetical protein JXA07_07850 [Spirochaetes bacterium]|nr:hypothetical protein [Spirochaetota bacterium]